MLIPLCFWHSSTHLDPLLQNLTPQIIYQQPENLRNATATSPNRMQYSYNAIHTDPNQVNSRIKLRAETIHTGPQVEIRGEQPIVLSEPDIQ